MSKIMERITVPLSDDDQVDGFNLGDTVTVTITGTIDKMEAEREYDYGEGDKGTYPPELGIEVASVKVKAKNKIERMMDAEEEDS